MSATATLPPPAIKQLADRLGIAVARFVDESDLGRRGFFRYGHRTNDTCRYCLDKGRIIGLCIRGEGITDLGWMTEEAFSEVEDLYFGENDFTALTIPANWTKMRRVDISRSPRLRRVTFEGSIDKLERLELRNTGLLNLSLPACPALELLDLSHSREIRKLTIDGPCPSLHSLHLRAAAQLETLEINGELPALHTLELVDCEKLRELPVAVILDSPLDRLYARGCVPNNCPVVFLEADRNVLDNVRSWFQAVQKGSEENRIVKLLINGNGNVGKSTLWCALKNLKESACTCSTHESTHGIKLTAEALSLTDVDFRGWDFGGQEVYQGTHRLFLTDGALQVLVLDFKSEEAARTGKLVPDRSNGDEAEPDKWVRNLALEHFYRRQKALGPRSKFVIVQTKESEGHKHDPTALKMKNEEGLMYRYLDAKKRYGVASLRTDLEDLAKELPIHGMRFPSSWVRVREWLQKNLKKSAATGERLRRMDKANFRTKVVKECEVTDSDEMIEALLTFLHAAGDVYRNERYLKDRIIIDLSWALDGIYRPLERGEFQRRATNNRGKIHVEDVFPETTGEDRSLLLEFMQSCGMCFPADKEADHERSSEYYIFPAFLTEAADPLVQRTWLKIPATPSWSVPLPYRDLPALHALICDLGRKTTEGRLWTNGIDLLLTDDREQAEEKKPLPEARCKIELLDGDDAAGAHCQLVVTLDDPEAAVWLPSIQEWIGAHFRDLDWAANEVARTQVQETVLHSRGREVVAQDGVRDKIGEETRVVFCVSNHPNFPQVDHEGERREISKQLNDFTVFIAPKIAITEDQLAAAIDDRRERVNVLHFVGHGEKKGVFLYEDDHCRNTQKLTSDELKDILRLAKKTNPDLECVVLNACLSNNLAMAASEVGLYAVGTTDELENQAGTYFSAGFYKSLSRDPGNYEMAFEHGKNFCERKIRQPVGDLFKFYYPKSTNHE